jgi:hypothetical protein
MAALESLLMNGLSLSGKERMQLLFPLCYPVRLVGGFFFFGCFCLFFEPGSCYITQACIKLKILLPPPPASASQIVELQECTNTPSLELILFPLEGENVVVSTRDVEMQQSFKKCDE